MGLVALRRPLVVFTIAVVMPGCSFLLLGDYSGGGAAEPAPVDGSAEASSSSSGGDTSTNNNDGASSGSDGSSDAPSGPFCAAHSTSSFCDDFDDPARPLAIAYEQVNNTGSGLAEKPKLDTAVSVSSPASVVMSTNALVVGTSGGSTIERSTFQTTSVAHFSSDILMDSIDPTRPQYFLQLAFGEGGYAKKYKVFFYVSAGLPYIAEESPENDAGVYTSQKTKFNQALPTLGTWWHLDIDVNFTLSKITAKLNGATVVDATMIADHQPGKTQMAVGITYVNGPAPVIKIHHDNILFDAK